MEIIFYTNDKGKSPFAKEIEEISKVEKARILACLKNIEDLGFDSPRVQFRQIIPFLISNYTNSLFYKY